jgi:hypothetical protein
VPGALPGPYEERQRGEIGMQVGHEPESTGRL